MPQPARQYSQWIVDATKKVGGRLEETREGLRLFEHDHKARRENPDATVGRDGKKQNNQRSGDVRLSHISAEPRGISRDRKYTLSADAAALLSSLANASR